MNWYSVFVFEVTSDTLAKEEVMVNEGGTVAPRRPRVPTRPPKKTAPPQKVPISRFYLLSLLKTRSDSPGAAPPQNFHILKFSYSDFYAEINESFCLIIHQF